MNVLVVSPHPDDETLGCGGTIIKHVSKGDRVHWLIFTNISEESGYSSAKVIARQKEIDAVSREYGFSKLIKLDFPTAKLDTLSRLELVKTAHNAVLGCRPAVVYLPYLYDAHSDHRVVFDTMQSALKQFRMPSVKKILMYEVISETEFCLPVRGRGFLPNSYSDISGHLNRKISIMRKYKDELKGGSFPRSVKNMKALAGFRGASSGVNYAEAFMVLKEVW